MNKKKLIAPIIIAVIIMLYYIGFAFVIVKLEDVALIVKILGGLIPLGLAGVVLFVLIERIKEIKGGEEDDLSQY